MNSEPFPIRPTALTIENFRGWRGRHELELDGNLTLIVGPNGSGKSGILNAIEWCLFGGEVAKKSSGIDERGEWEIAHRQAEGRVVVELLLSVQGGNARLVRARPVGAKTRDPDVVRLELANGDVLEGYEVTDWMSWNGLPDWSDWKNSFCQHQELLRGRVTDSGERSAQLGALLGLEEYKKVNDRLKASKAKDLAKVAQTELAAIEDELERSLERPGRELRELEDRLEQRGIARTEIGEPMLVARAEQLVAEGRRISELLDLQAPLPDPAACTQEEVLRWAHDWEPRVNLRRVEIERELSALRLNLQELEGAIEGIEPARRRWQDARAAWKRCSEEHGSAENLEQQLESLQREREELRDQERQRDAMRQLLRQAAEAMSGRETDDCPVCGHPDPLLAENLRRSLEDADDPLNERFEALDAREQKLREQRAKLAQLQSELELADSAHQKLQKNLEARLPAGARNETDSLEQLGRQGRDRIAVLQGVLRGIEEHLGPHRTRSEALEMLLKWRAARARADAATGDLGSIEAWDELQDAIDEAAGLACDIEVLGRLAREAQEARSGERVKEVNRSLGEHFGRISGRPGDEGVHVVVKSTATRLNYLLVDGKGENITPILNQAALNALSFAMLFARAGERAEQGLPQWLVLDDPGQSLDQDCLEGLADAIAEVSGRAPVLIATYPGALATALERSALANRRVFNVSSDVGSNDSTIREVRP